MVQTKRHKVFISYHHEQDEEWKNRFVRAMKDRIIDLSIYVGDIVDTGFPTADTLRRIREEHIAEVTVAVVLIGPCTWQRKFVDWEIGAALRDTAANPRSGLLGILLPNHPDFGKPRYNPKLVPPRLADNCVGTMPFASIIRWRGRAAADQIQDHIHRAFRRRRRQPDPDNARPASARNWNRPCTMGWQD